MNLLTVGTVAFDDVETPYGRVQNSIGGAATFIALAASYFIKDIRLVSIIGDDYPQDVLAMLEGRGINLDGVEVRPGEKSFFWAGRYHQNMNDRDTLETQLNVLADFNPVLPKHYQDSRFLMLGNLTPAVQMQVIDQMTERPALIALDTMNYWMNSALEELLVVLRRIDVLIINDEEARQLSGQHSLVKAAKYIFDLGPRILVIKKGEHGALLFHKEEIFFAPALPLQEVVDPTGAGDTFAGGFMGYLAKTEDLSFANLKRGLIYASTMASFCVEDFGIQKLAALDADSINARIRQFIALANFDITYHLE